MSMADREDNKSFGGEWGEARGIKGQARAGVQVTQAQPEDLKTRAEAVESRAELVEEVTPER